MAKGIHKGTELNNVKETWNENERRRAEGEDAGRQAGVGEDLQQLISEQAAEYDNQNKDDQLLSGDRASVNDDRGNNAPDE